MVHRDEPAPLIGEAIGLKSFCGVSTDLVSVDSNELQGPSASKSVSVEPGIAISANGRFVAFATATQLATGDANNKVDVYLRDRDTDADGIYDEPESSNTLWVSGGSINAPNGASLSPSISDDGSLVAFESTATNLAAGAGANGAGSDIFVKNVKTSALTRITNAAGAATAPSLSGNGTRVAYQLGTGATATVNVATTTSPAILQTKTGTKPALVERRQLVRVQRGQPGVRHQRHGRCDRADEHARRRCRRQRRVR